MSFATTTPIQKSSWDPVYRPLRFLQASIQRLEEMANFLLFYASRNLVTKTKVGPYPYRSHLQPLRLLSGTSNVLQDSMMTKWRHIGDGWLPGYIETWKSIYSNISMQLDHSLCQNQRKLLSGTSNVLQDFRMTKWRHIGDGWLPGYIETWK